MAGPLATSSEPSSRGARLLPLWPLLVFVVLALAAGVAYERETSFWAYCQSSLYAPVCLGQIQYVQLLGAVWVAAAAAVGVLMVFGRATSGRLARRVPPLAWLGYGAFLLAWALLGIVAAEAQSYGLAPRGIGEAFLHTYVIASLLLFAAIFLRPRPGGTVAKAATLLATVHGLVATVLAFASAWGLAFPNVVTA